MRVISGVLSQKAESKCRSLGEAEDAIEWTVLLDNFIEHLVRLLDRLVILRVKAPRPFVVAVVGAFINALYTRARDCVKFTAHVGE